MTSAQRGHTRRQRRYRSAECRIARLLANRSGRCRSERGTYHPLFPPAPLFGSHRRRAPEIFGLPAWIAAGQMRVTEEPGSRMSESGIGQMFVPIGALADREIPLPALLAFAADDREWHNDPVADLQLTLSGRSDLDHLTHRFVAQDVALLHAGHEMVE